MKRISLFSALILFAFPCTYSQTVAPKIINTWPAFGDCNVDTNLTVIQFEFDQDMSSGYSFPDCSDMVPIVGTPVWKSKRIIEVPVKLTPGCFYQIQMNSADYRNLTNEYGIPMNPDYLVFRSKNYNDSGTIDTSLNKANYEKFCDYFLKHYSHKDLNGIDWENELKTIKDDIIVSKSNSEFGIKILKILKKANDIHLSVTINNRSFGCGNFRLVPVSFNLGDVFSQLTDMQISQNNVVFTGKLGNTGYILISSLNSYFAQDISFGIEKTIQMKDLPFIILDLRLNRGGNEQLAASFVSMLLSDTITYEKVVLYNEATEQYDTMLEKKVVPDNTSIQYKGKIFVLMGGNVVSSAESFVLMLKQMPNVQLIGSTTYGASGNPQPFNVTDSVIVNIPSWLAYDMNGTLIEGNGIEPDVKIEFPEEDFAENDPIFEYALDTINHLPYLLVTPVIIRIGESISSSISFDINSNINWIITCDQSWLTIHSAIDSGTATITAIATENYSSLSRKATVTIAGNGVLPKLVYITQSGAAPVLHVSANNLIMEGSANSTDTFNIISNINWNVKSNQPWLTVNMTSGSDSAMIIATATENSTGVQRSASIVVSGNRVSSEYILVHQAANIVNTTSEISSNAKITVFPNPTSGLLELSGLNLFKDFSIEVSDYLGNVILNMSHKSVPSLQIDLSIYPSGLYLIRIRSGNEIRNFKVLKK